LLSISHFIVDATTAEDFLVTATDGAFGTQTISLFSEQVDQGRGQW
jgi:hypothetical protein